MQPSYEEFKRLAREFEVIPVWEEVLADFETPISVFSRMSQGRAYGFLLESAETGAGLGRYSFAGVDFDAVVAFEKGGARVLDVEEPVGALWKLGGRLGAMWAEAAEKELVLPQNFLRRAVLASRAAPLQGMEHFWGGAVGFFGYGCARFFESLNLHSVDVLGLPGALFMITRSVIVFDHFTRKLKIVVPCHVGQEVASSRLRKIYLAAQGAIDELRQRALGRSASGNTSLVGDETMPEFSSNFTQSRFEDGVRRAVEYIKAGDILQVVLSQRLEVKTRARPLDLYRALRSINPSPYMFCLLCGDFSLIGSSPEPFVKVLGKMVLTKPIAGTRKRGGDKEEDARLERELLTNEKERCEHVMLVDLGRNDLGRVCEPGSVRVERFMDVERYSHVMHIVSTVTGRLGAGRDCLDALASAFPAGTVSGAPKIRAMQIIDEIEREDRGPYAGAVAYIGYDGNLDSCITIRTAILRQGIAHVQAGAGIVYDSDPEKEYLETLRKAQAVLAAVNMAEGTFA